MTITPASVLEQENCLTIPLVPPADKSTSLALALDLEKSILPGGSLHDPSSVSLDPRVTGRLSALGSNGLIGRLRLAAIKALSHILGSGPVDSVSLATSLVTLCVSGLAKRSLGDRQSKANEKKENYGASENYRPSGASSNEFSLVDFYKVTESMLEQGCNRPLVLGRAQEEDPSCRIELVKLAKRILGVLGSKLGVLRSYLQPLVFLAIAGNSDDDDDVCKECLDFTVSLVKFHGDLLTAFAKSIVLSLTPVLIKCKDSHGQITKALEVIQRLTLTSEAFNVFTVLSGWQDPQVVHLSAFYSDFDRALTAGKVNYLTMLCCSKDASIRVRAATGKALKQIMECSDHVQDLGPLVTPLMLFLATDDSDEVRSSIGAEKANAFSARANGAEKADGLGSTSEPLPRLSQTYSSEFKENISHGLRNILPALLRPVGKDGTPGLGEEITQERLLKILDLVFTCFPKMAFEHTADLCTLIESISEIHQTDRSLLTIQAIALEKKGASPVLEESKKPCTSLMTPSVLGICRSIASYLTESILNCEGRSDLLGVLASLDAIRASLVSPFRPVDRAIRASDFFGAISTFVISITKVEMGSRAVAVAGSGLSFESIKMPIVGVQDLPGYFSYVALSSSLELLRSFVQDVFGTLKSALSGEPSSARLIESCDHLVFYLVEALKTNSTSPLVVGDSACRVCQFVDLLGGLDRTGLESGLDNSSILALSILIPQITVIDGTSTASGSPAVSGSKAVFRSTSGCGTTLDIFESCIQILCKTANSHIQTSMVRIEDCCSFIARQTNGLSHPASRKCLFAVVSSQELSLATKIRSARLLFGPRPHSEPEAHKNHMSSYLKECHTSRLAPQANQQSSPSQSATEVLFACLEFLRLSLKDCITLMQTGGEIGKESAVKFGLSGSSAEKKRHEVKQLLKDVRELGKTALVAFENSAKVDELVDLAAKNPAVHIGKSLEQFLSYSRPESRIFDLLVEFYSKRCDCISLCRLYLRLESHEDPNTDRAVIRLSKLGSIRHALTDLLKARKEPFLLALMKCRQKGFVSRFNLLSKILAEVQAATPATRFEEVS